MGKLEILSSPSRLNSLDPPTGISRKIRSDFLNFLFKGFRNFRKLISVLVFGLVGAVFKKFRVEDGNRFKKTGWKTLKKLKPEIFPRSF